MKLIRKYRLFILTSILIAVVGGITFYGFYLKYQYQSVRHAVRTEIKSTVEKKDLTSLEFTFQEVKSLSWKHCREFSYQQKMYDVIYSEFTNVGVRYYCWVDHEESALNKKMDQYIQSLLGNSDQDKNHRLSLAKLRFSLFFEHSFIPVFLNSDKSTKHFNYPQKTLVGALKEQFSPPELS